MGSIYLEASYKNASLGEFRRVVPREADCATYFVSGSRYYHSCPSFGKFYMCYSCALWISRSTKDVFVRVGTHEDACSNLPERSNSCFLCVVFVLCNVGVELLRMFVSADVVLERMMFVVVAHCCFRVCRFFIVFHLGLKRSTPT